MLAGQAAASTQRCSPLRHNQAWYPAGGIITFGYSLLTTQCWIRVVYTESTPLYLSWTDNRRVLNIILGGTLNLTIHHSPKRIFCCFLSTLHSKRPCRQAQGGIQNRANGFLLCTRTRTGKGTAGKDSKIQRFTFYRIIFFFALPVSHSDKTTIKNCLACSA